MALPRAAADYDQDNESRTRTAIETALARMYARGESIELYPNMSVVIRSPNGARWKLAVSNSGVLSVVAA